MSQDLCIAIAVSRPNGLEPIPGALPSAKRLLHWAARMGYEVELVSDERDPVTSAQLREVFNRRLAGGGQRRLIVHFAGHGLMRDGTDEYWLLSDWDTQSAEAVRIMQFCRRLSSWLPEQLAIVSDACRSLPNARGRWVEGTGLVDVASYDERPVQLSLLHATRAAQPAFGTPPEAPEAYCFFTKVLVDALNGAPPSAVALDSQRGRVVTSDTLAETLEREVPVLASRYQCLQVPEVQLAWRAPRHIWTELDHLQLPPASEPELLPPPPPPQLRTLAGSARNAADQQQQQRARHLANDMEARWQGARQAIAANFDARASFVLVEGARAVKLAAGAGVSIQQDFLRPAWFQLHRESASATPVLVQLADGRWLGGAVCEGYTSVFSVIADGETSLLLRPREPGPPGDGVPAPHRMLSAATLEWLSLAVVGGSLASVQDQWAARHDPRCPDPLFTTLAGYALARSGSTDHIRRLLAHHALARQPAPFDLALLARVPLRHEGAQVVADLPAVDAQAPVQHPDAALPWTRESTSAAAVPLAGSFPWLRQGWRLLEDHAQPEWRRLAGQFAHELLPGLVTLLTPGAGARLAGRISQGEL